MRYGGGGVGHVNQDSRWKIHNGSDDSGDEDMDVDLEQKEQLNPKTDHMAGISNATEERNHANAHHREGEENRSASDSVLNDSDSDSDSDESDSNMDLSSSCDQSSSSDDGDIGPEDGEDEGNDDDGYGSF